MAHNSIEERLNVLIHAKAKWEEPSQYDLSKDDDKNRLGKLLDENQVTSVNDGIDHIASDIFEIRNPNKKNDEVLRRNFVAEIKEQGASYGRWFFFPWSGELTRYPLSDDHYELRTARNQGIVNKEEQARLRTAKIAVFGLSVGSAIAHSVFQLGIGNTAILADMDEISPTNLNRLAAELPDVGEKKIDHEAKRLSRMDPYIKQVHLREGVNMQNLEEVVMPISPDVIVDAIDSIHMKVGLRKWAGRHRVPIVMGTDAGIRSIIDVERYDKDSNATPFNGRLTASDIEVLADPENPPSRSRMARILIKLVGIEHGLADRGRLLRSFMQVDKKIAGTPQLGKTATLGGALVADTIYRMLTEEKTINIKSGRRYFDPRKNK